MQHSNTAGCILLKFYIKPQHTANVYNLLYVVSYRNSTSNHNSIGFVYILFTLYLIEILHQTTTASRTIFICRSCILSKFYIKPQRSMVFFFSRLVVSYRNSTSNHNIMLYNCVRILLYLIEILHQTTTIDIHECN